MSTKGNYTRTTSFILMTLQGHHHQLADGIIIL
jgi:hypothetical protein